MGRFSLRTLLELALLATFVGCLGFVAYVAMEERTFQADQRAGFEALLARSLREPRVPELAGRTVRPAVGAPVGYLQIPNAGIAVMVTAGDDNATLRHSVGWLTETALPGEPGNAVLAGHRDTFFRGLEDLRQNDPIWITTARGRLEYRVAGMEIVDPSRLDVLAPTGTRTLTLVTCYPFHYIGAAPQRYIVRAKQVS
ncbi:MAG: class D sortase [Acidobacteriota bacterium]